MSDAEEIAELESKNEELVKGERTNIHNRIIANTNQITANTNQITANTNQITALIQQQTSGTIIVALIILYYIVLYYI
jgi:hypothetical protein